MFINTLYTDGYTCRVSFARNVPEAIEEEKMKLGITDFSQSDIDEHFHPCFLDPGRNSAYVAYYGKNQIRKLSTTEYYSMSGSPNRTKKEDDLKITQGLKELETSIPTPKTSIVVNYATYIQYMMMHMATFFNFYSFRTASIRWNNYRGRQCALDEAANILINGGKKYNARKRKKTKSNRRKRKKMTNRQNPGNPHLPVNIRYCFHSISLNHSY